MVDFHENMEFNEVFDAPASHIINEHSEIMSNDTVNSNLQINDEALRLLFITIALISVLACMSICLSVFICVCLNRRRNEKNFKKKDQLLLPEKCEQINNDRQSQFSSSKPVAPFESIVSRSSTSEQKTSSSSTVVQMRNDNSRSFYFDQYDDIPFIDDSRPNSFIEVARV